MKKAFILTILIITALLMSGCISVTEDKESQSIPDGYQGIYVVEELEGDDSMFPVGITGLVFKRAGNSYQIVLSNVDVESKEAEEIEELEFEYTGGEFRIQFGGILKIKPVENGFAGILDFDGTPQNIVFRKIK